MSDEAKVRDAAYHNWIINVPPETEDATDAWNTLDDGATARRFRAAIEDAFNGGWQAATACAREEALEEAANVARRGGDALRSGWMIAGDIIALKGGA